MINMTESDAHAMTDGGDGSRQLHDSSFSSDDTEFLGLPSLHAPAKTTAPLAPPIHRPPVSDAATQPDQFLSFTRMIAFVDSTNESDSNADGADHASPSTTPTPSASSRETTPDTYNGLSNRCWNRHCSPEWSSSEESTTFYADKNSVLSSACEADRQLATSEYFKSSCGGYFTQHLLSLDSSGHAFFSIHLRRTF